MPLPRSAVVSHASAAAVLGIELLHVGDGPVLTVPRCRSRVRVPGTKVHRHDLAAEEVVEREGVLVTSPLRTVLDLARSLPLREAVVAADSSLRNGLLSYADLVTGVAALPPARGVPACREVLALCDPRSGSVLETLLRLLLDAAGLRPFETQYVVRAGGTTVARVDVAWPAARLVVEADGFAFHADRGRYRSDRRRGNALVLSGWQVLRFSWEDVVERPDVVVGQVRLALAEHTSRARHAG